MDCMQSKEMKGKVMAWPVSIPQAVWIACNILLDVMFRMAMLSFNTASGMDCMQFLFALEAVAAQKAVSIPQAVWIACNTVPHSPWDS